VGRETFPEEQSLFSSITARMLMFLWRTSTLRLARTLALPALAWKKLRLIRIKHL